MRLPACARPRPMWRSRPAWRRVTTPVVSMRSRRAREGRARRGPGGGGVGGDPGGVDAVAADAVVPGQAGSGGVGLGPGRVGLRGGGTVERAVGSDGVVVAAEPVELALERGEGGSGGLRGQPFLLGLVEAFDLPAGQRVVGAGVV